MEPLLLDFETFSPVDIGLGVYAYAAGPEAEPLLLSYAFGHRGVAVHDFTEDPKWPIEILDHIHSGGPVVHHGDFDRVILKQFLPDWVKFKNSQSIDTSVLCAEFGLPLALKNAAKFLGLEEQKDPVGWKAIQTFCIPRRGKRKYRKTTRTSGPTL